jgi:3-oxoadipate enol-lactonase
MQTVTAGDVELYYEQQGDGPDLLLIMGLGAHLGAWALQIPAFARQFRVTAFDNRGAGRSAAPDRPSSIRGMADDTAALLDALGIARAHVVGASMGGMIAQELAINHPQRVDRLVLACSRARSGPLRHVLAPAQAALRDLDLDPAERALVTMPWAYTSAFMSQPDRVLRALELLRKDPYPIQPHAYRRQQEAVMAHDTLARLGQVRAPTLVLVGAEDILTPVAEAVELAEAIPGAHLHVLPRGGHAFTAEYPDEVNQAVLAFLTRPD